MNKTYKRISQAHPVDGLATVQTGEVDDPGYYLGATYHEILANEALDHGSLLTGVLRNAAASVMASHHPVGDDPVAAINSTFGEALAQEPAANE